MRLTAFSDYTLRVLIYLGLNDRSLATIADVAEAYGISENHLMKVVHFLGRRGYVDTVRGQGGGIRLAKAPHRIVIGNVVRDTERDLTLVECFGPSVARCPIESDCVLRDALGEALAAFFNALDRYTLADLLEPKARLRQILPLAAGAGRPAARSGSRS